MANDLLREVQEHSLARAPLLGLPPTSKALLRALRSRLTEASNSGEILNPLGDVLSQVTFRPPPTDISAAAKAAGDRSKVQCIFGGDKNQARVRDRRHFERPDGAWFNFAITLIESKAGLELLAFDFEIRFSTDAAVPFIRFDLNLAGHANEAREMRCHVHPGSDEIQVPSPLMSPLEILELFIVQLRPTRVGRAPTGFEIDWHRAYLQRHAPVPPASPAVVPEDGAAPQDLGETDVPAGEGEVDGGVES